MDDIRRAIEILNRNKPTSDPRLCGKELCSACDVAISAMQELQKYRELEEQGLLFRCPCKIGSKAYRIYMRCPSDPDEFKPEYCTDHEGSCGKCQHRVPVIVEIEFLAQHIPECGTKVFATREAAEKALETERSVEDEEVNSKG